MKPRKTRELCNNLQKKGFIPTEKDHIFYTLYIDGKRTSIRTIVSHGCKEYSIPLLNQMAKQLSLTNSQFDSLIECPLTYDDFIEILRKKGSL